MADNLTIEEVLDWAQDPMQTCGDAPVIMNTTFDSLSKTLARYNEVKLTSNEIIEILIEQSKRFSGCGGNFADETGMIRRNLGNGRKNSQYGWQYIIDLIT